VLRGEVLHGGEDFVLFFAEAEHRPVSRDPGMSLLARRRSSTERPVERALRTWRYRRGTVSVLWFSTSGRTGGTVLSASQLPRGINDRPCSQGLGGEFPMVRAVQSRRRAVARLTLVMACADHAGTLRLHAMVLLHPVGWPAPTEPRQSRRRVQYPQDRMWRALVHIRPCWGSGRIAQTV
jgi:hypothetical protein